MSASNYLESLINNAFRGGGNGTNITAPAAVYLKLHTGDPGEDGTANASAETTRKAATYGADSGGVATLSNTPTWDPWAAGTETITHVSEWDHVSAGNCLGSGALAASKAMSNGDALELSGTRTVT